MCLPTVHFSSSFPLPVITLDVWNLGIRKMAVKTCLHLLLQAAICFSAVATKIKTSTSAVNGICWSPSRY